MLGITKIITTTDAQLNDMEVTDRKVNRLNYLVKQLKKIRSVQGGLLQLSELASKVQDLTEFYPELNYVVSSILQADNFYIALENQEQELELVYFVDEKDDSTIPEANDIGVGITGYVYRTGSSVLCDKNGYLDMVKDGLFTKLGSEPELWFGVPLKRAGRCIGVMAIQSYHKISSINEQTVALFENLGLHLMTAINRVKRREFLEQEIKRQTSDLQEINLNLQEQIQQREQAEKLQEVLFQIAELSASNLKMAAFYKRLHQSLAQLMDVENCYIALVENDTLSFPFYVDKFGQHCEPRKMANGLTEFTINKKSCQLISKTRAESLQQQGLISRDLVSHDHLSTCWLGAPLIIDHQVIGVITVQSYEQENEYGEKDLQLLNFVSHHIARAIERKLSAQALQTSYDELEKKILERTQELRQANLFLRLQVDERRKAEQKLFHQANHDALTSLPNRSCFMTKVEETLARAKRHPDHKFALLFIDLDNFKQINDSYGHQAGDDFLIEVSQRLKLSVREHDAVARLGGDEFVVLLDLLPTTDLAEEIASRVIEKVAQPYQLKGCNVLSGASIGIALFEHDYQDVESIMQDADLAMYQAKSLGRGQFVVFEPSMREATEQDDMLQSVQQAVENKAIDLTTQVVVSQAIDQVSCQIVTPIWRTQGVGLQHPDTCQQDLDRAGLSIEVDRQLITKLATRSDPKTGLTLLPVTCQHLTHLRLTKSLIEQLQVLPAPESVVLLFNETDLIKLQDSHLNNIKQLKRAGYKVGINHFGQGNMTIGLLAKVAVDFLIFDPSLIRSIAANPVESALLNSAIEICGQLNVHPILTGIDLQQHLQRAASLKVDLIAGNLVTAQELKKNPPQLTIQHSA